MTIVRRILPVLLAAVLLSACGETKDVLPEIEQEVKQEVETVLEEVEPTPEPTQTPEEAKTMASTASNATKDAPQITDPSTWNDAGKNIMEALEKQYAPYGMTLQAKEGTPYFLAVNRDANVVTVYTADEDGRYTVPFMAMVCSGGMDTPLGYYATPATGSTPHVFSTPTCSTACPTIASTRTTSSTMSTTCWVPRPAWAASGWKW